MGLLDSGLSFFSLSDLCKGGECMSIRDASLLSKESLALGCGDVCSVESLNLNSKGQPLFLVRSYTREDVQISPFGSPCGERNGAVVDSRNFKGKELVLEALVTCGQ